MQIFGVVNASPDSLAEFSFVDSAAAARARGQGLLAAGATYFDIGAEGSSEFSDGVTAEAEWARLRDPLAGLVSLGKERAVDVAVDTRHAKVARQALQAGATILNAGDALQSEDMLQLAADSDVPIVLPYMLGRDFRDLDKTLRQLTTNPAETMLDWFDHHLRRLRPWGLVERLLLDPGIGFAPAHWDWSSRCAFQKAIYEALPRLREFKLPLYVPVAWRQSPDKLELMDIALAADPEFVRAHIPSQVFARYHAVQSGSPLGFDQLTDAHV